MLKSKFVKMRTILWLAPSVLLLLCQTSIVASTQSDFSHYFATKSHYLAHLEMGAYAFSKDNKTAGIATLFAPLWQKENHLAFMQARYYPQSNQQLEYNISGGYRSLDGDNVYGVATSYDHMKKQDNLSFDQVSFNGSFWHNHWFANANIYVPLGDKIQIDPTLSSSRVVKGEQYDHIFYGNGFVQAMTGGDVLIGNNIWRGLTVSAGGYYFNGDSISDVTGPEARAEYVWYAPEQHKLLGIFDRITAVASVQHDTPRGTNAYAGLKFSVLLPGQHSSLQGVARHMTDTILRDPDIVSERYLGPQTELTNPDGTPLNIATVSDRDGFNNALADSKADVIAVDGTISGINDAQIDRSVTITGKNYVFTRDGEIVTIQVAHDGALHAAKDADLLEIMPEVNDAVKSRVITIRDLGLRVDDENVIGPNRLIFTRGAWDDDGIYTDRFDGNIGTINIFNDVGYGGAVALGVTDDSTGTIDFIGNTFDSGKFSPLDPGVLEHNYHIINFSAAWGSTLEVSSFSDSKLINTNSQRMDHFQAVSSNAGTLIIDKITGNTFSGSGSISLQALAAMSVGGEGPSTMTVKNFYGNTFTAGLNMNLTATNGSNLTVSVDRNNPNRNFREANQVGNENGSTISCSTGDGAQVTPPKGFVCR